MKVEVRHLIIFVLAVSASILAALISMPYISEGNILGGVILLVATFMLACSAVLVLLIIKNYKNTMNRTEYVNCFRLKKPGIEKQSDEEIVPKGKAAIK